MLSENKKKYIQRNLREEGVHNLSLANAGIMDEDVKEIVDIVNSEGKHLFELDLECNNIGDQGFFELLQLRNVNKINLSRNNVTQTGLKQLFIASKECLIKYIDLSRNALDLYRNEETEVMRGEDLIKLIAGYSGSVDIQVTSGNGLTVAAIQEIKKIQSKKRITMLFEKQAIESKSFTDEFVSSVDKLKEAQIADISNNKHVLKS